MIFDKETTTEVAVSDDFDTAATVVIFTPGVPSFIKKLIMVCTELSAGSSVVTVGIRNVDDTTSVTLGTFTVGAAIPLNAVRYVSLIKPKTAAVVSTIDGSTTYATIGMPKIKPGQELFLTSDGVGTAGIFNCYVNYVPDGFNERATVAEQGYAPVEIAFVPA